MKRIVLTAVIFGFAVACWSQAYYEASGRTQVFTLKAGVKVGPLGVRNGSVMHSGQGRAISVRNSRGGIDIVLPFVPRSSADITLYDIKGRQIYRQRAGAPGMSLRLETKTFAPGIYSLLVRVDGQSMTRMVALSGRSE